MLLKCSCPSITTRAPLLLRPRQVFDPERLEALLEVEAHQNWAWLRWLYMPASVLGVIWPGERLCLWKVGGAAEEFTGQDKMGAPPCAPRAIHSLVYVQECINVQCLLYSTVQYPSAPGLDARNHRMHARQLGMVSRA